MTVPSEGSRRCMIFRYDRTLTDGCESCGRSETLCHGLREMEAQTCCPACRHDQ